MTSKVRVTEDGRVYAEGIKLADSVEDLTLIIHDRHGARCLQRGTRTVRVSLPDLLDALLSHHTERIGKTF